MLRVYRQAAHCGKKNGGNYAASLLAGRKAAASGFNQVLWLDALEHRFAEEVGAMNDLVSEIKNSRLPDLFGWMLTTI